jgi:hypothetical protein
MIRDGYDDVNGVIVGGDYVGWCVAYDERPQSDKQYADNAEQAIAQGTALIAELKAKYCGHPCYLYPDATKWTVRIYGE